MTPHTELNVLLIVDIVWGIATAGLGLYVMGRSRKWRIVENVGLLFHYFRVQPRLATRAFITSPLMGLLVCPLRGHTETNVSRILGVCNSCFKPMRKEKDGR